MPKEVVILGSTGSIGTQALGVIATHWEDFQVLALSAGSNIDLLALQTVIFRVPKVGIAAEDKAEKFIEKWQVTRKQLQDPMRLREALQQAINYWSRGYAQENDACSALIADIEADLANPNFPIPKLITGPEAAALLAAEADEKITVLNGITGGVGLSATLAALTAGATLALANKESLVVGGALVKAAMCRPGQIIPVDSEHSAIAQALTSGKHEKGLTSPVLSGTSEVAQLVLTASGGPFRGRSRQELAQVTLQAALNHPTWTMGPVVTINSSTLVNKGLELIEAHLLFDIPAENIVPVIHPTSQVHSMVTWKDGSTIAQASTPDMGLPIALGLNGDKRLERIVAPLDWSKPQDWHFEPVDHETFPAIKLAGEAVKNSATHPAVYNAANEVFVEAFMQEKIPYLAIVDNLARVLEAHRGIWNPDLEQVKQAEKEAQELAKSLLTI